MKPSQVSWPHKHDIINFQTSQYITTTYSKQTHWFPCIFVPACPCPQWPCSVRPWPWYRNIHWRWFSGFWLLCHLLLSRRHISIGCCCYINEHIFSGMLLLRHKWCKIIISYYMTAVMEFILNTWPDKGGHDESITIDSLIKITDNPLFDKVANAKMVPGPGTEPTSAVFFSVLHTWSKTSTYSVDNFILPNALICNAFCE